MLRPQDMLQKSAPTDRLMTPEAKLELFIRVKQKRVYLFLLYLLGEGRPAAHSALTGKDITAAALLPLLAS